MTGMVLGPVGTPLSPWHAAQDSAFASIDLSARQPELSRVPGQRRSPYEHRHAGVAVLIVEHHERDRCRYAWRRAGDTLEALEIAGDGGPKLMVLGLHVRRGAQLRGRLFCGS